MTIPAHVRTEVRKRLWDIADDLGWASLPASTKARYYEHWTRDPSIGGILSRYIDRGQVRVYLKDTLLKGYARSRLADASRPFRILDIPDTARIVEEYIKPHGRRLDDGRIVCWGRADDWKLVLMAVYERAYSAKGARPFGVVLMMPVGRLYEVQVREMVEDAAGKLGIERLVWLDV